MSEYKFQEYPKWIFTPDERNIIVQDADEEALEMSAKPIVHEHRPSGNIPTNALSNPENQGRLGDNRMMLQARAAALGVKVDGRWSDDRLKSEIEKASEPK